jgi:Transposase DDE domain
MDRLLDLYTDYLQVTFGQASATGLSRMLDGEVSHDKVTRLLSGNEFTSADLWLSVKPLVREYESPEGCLIFDDVIIRKPHTDENELISWHFDHNERRSVKGINLLSAFYHSQPLESDLPVRLPVSFEAVKKEILFCDIKTRQEKRQSKITKNELMRQMIEQCIKNRLQFRYVLADSWFASAANMMFIHRQKKFFIFDMKSNRLACDSLEKRNRGEFVRIDNMKLPEKTPVRLFLKDLEIEVFVCKQVFKNEDSQTKGGVCYLVSNDPECTGDRFISLYKKRWGVEEYHKSLKQNTAIANSPTRTTRTQLNHLFGSIMAYVKFERLKLARKLNHFNLKSKLYAVAIKAAFKELSALKLTGEKTSCA